MQPCGVLVLRVMLEERWGWSLTACGRLHRKSLIHMHREVRGPRSGSLVTSLLRTIVLNAEQ